MYLETIKRLQDGAIGDIVATRVYWNGSTPWVHKREDLEQQVRPQADAKWSTSCATGTTSPGSAATTSSSSTSTTWTSINWLKNGYPVKANGMGGRQVRTGKDYGEIFDHHAVEFEYADGSRMFSQCRHIPGCWNSVSEHAHGTKGTADISDGHDQARPAATPGAIAAPSPTRTRSSTTICSPAFAPAIRSTKPKPGAKSTHDRHPGPHGTYSGKEITWDEALNSQINLAPEEFSFDATPKSLPDANGLYPLPVPGMTKVV